MADGEDIQPLVCDNGTGMVKAGFAGDDAPRAICAGYMYLWKMKMRSNMALVIFVLKTLTHCDRNTDVDC
ncbi:hypothetical protein PVK06_025675 [Gossypium arboreum]|uniref:Uncharacterized protein n=1 Tax=Gossypium arboreum TaxID=29729 RepID=A0ABR0NVU7_GOSAR|nr:hypothetical protein PVK06_025675 [Gossypium arboreum]